MKNLKEFLFEAYKRKSDREYTMFDSTTTQAKSFLYIPKDKEDLKTCKNGAYDGFHDLERESKTPNRVDDKEWQRRAAKIIANYKKAYNCFCNIDDNKAILELEPGAGKNPKGAIYMFAKDKDRAKYFGFRYKDKNWFENGTDFVGVFSRLDLKKAQKTGKTRGEETANENPYFCKFFWNEKAANAWKEYIETTYPGENVFIIDMENPSDEAIEFFNKHTNITPRRDYVISVDKIEKDGFGGVFSFTQDHYTNSDGRSGAVALGVLPTNEDAMDILMPWVRKIQGKKEGGKKWKKDKNVYYGNKQIYRM